MNTFMDQLDRVRIASAQRDLDEAARATLREVSDRPLGVESCEVKYLKPDRYPYGYPLGHRWDHRRERSKVVVRSGDLKITIESSDE